MDIHYATRDELLCLARDALRIAGRGTPPGRSVEDLGRMVGLLTETLDALDGALEEVARLTSQECGSGRVVAVDGMFAGDTDAAADATVLWIRRGRKTLHQARPAVVNAHIAAGGLAQS